MRHRHRGRGTRSRNVTASLTMTRGATAWASHRARSPRPTRENDLLLRACVEVDLQAAAQRVRDRAAPLRLLGDIGELGGIDALEPFRNNLKPRGLDLQTRLSEIGADRGRDVQLSRLRVLAAERGRQRHGVAGRVCRGDQLLGTGLAPGLLDAGREGNWKTERAGASLHLALSLLDGPFPINVSVSLERRHV